MPADQLLNVATTLSNAAAVPVIALLLRHRRWIEGLAFLCSMMASVAFHACETDGDYPVSHGMPGLITGVPTTAQRVMLRVDEAFALLAIAVTLPRWRYLLCVRANLLLALAAGACQASELIANRYAYTVVHCGWHVGIFWLSYRIFAAWLADKHAEAAAVAAATAVDAPRAKDGGSSAAADEEEAHGALPAAALALHAMPSSQSQSPSGDESGGGEETVRRVDSSSGSAHYQQAAELPLQQQPTGAVTATEP